MLTHVSLTRTSLVASYWYLSPTIMAKTVCSPVVPRKIRRTESNESTLDHDMCVELCKNIDELTHSGKSILDPNLMKQIKGVCKKSDEYVRYAYEQIFDQLEKDHAEIRLSAFQMANELFNRSHVFRDCLLTNFQEFMELTIESNPNFPLPEPKTAAQTLKNSAAEAIQQWNEKFGKDYKKLALGYNYLKHCKKLDFNEMEVRTQAERKRIDEQNRRTEMMRKQRLDTALSEMFDSSEEIKEALLEVENSLKLLLPDLESFQIHGLDSPVDSKDSENPFDKSLLLEETCRKTKDPSQIKNKGHKTKVPMLKKDTDTPSGHPDSEVGVTKEEGSSEIEGDRKTTMSGSSSGIEIKTTKDNLGDSNSNIDGSNSSAALKEPIISVLKTALNENLINNEEESEDSQDESFTGSEADEEEDICEEDVVRAFGLGNHKYRMSVEINTSDFCIKENEDNTDVINALTDAKRLIVNKFIPKVKRWLEVFSKTGANETDLRRAIDMKNTLEMAVEKVARLNIKRLSGRVRTVMKKNDGEDDDDDDDFEDVPEKEGYEEDIPEHLKEHAQSKQSRSSIPTPRGWKPVISSTGKVSGELDPTTPEATLARVIRRGKERLKERSATTSELRSQPCPSSPSGSKSSVPVVAFGTDLLFWGEDKPETPMVVRYESSHRFWNSVDVDKEIVDKVAVESMNTRTINFTGKFEPVKWTCRAPLQNGKLCPRQDRVKCPFHGKVIGRDKTGQASTPEDRLRIAIEEEEKRKSQPAEWENPQLQAEIEAATGVSLNPLGAKRKGGKRGAQMKHPGLTNIKKVANTSKKRLEKKVLSRNALRRVAEKMSGLENRRFKDKFGNNFNYALD